MSNSSPIAAIFLQDEDIDVCIKSSIHSIINIVNDQGPRLQTWINEN